MLRIAKTEPNTHVPCAIAAVCATAAAAGGGCPLVLCCVSADSLLGDACRVMRGSVVKNSVLGSCAFIDDNCYIQVRACVVMCLLLRVFVKCAFL